MFKPMLAGKAPEFDKIRYPVLATPKLDGIRCVVLNGKALSRSLKPIPNNWIRSILERPEFENFDGELVLADRTRGFNEVSSAVMSKEGVPVFQYVVFDYISGRDYCDRIEQLKLSFSFGNLPTAEPLLPTYIIGPEILKDYEETCLREGYEGVMTRDPYGPYKYGRSTAKEGWLLKIKRFEDGEAVVIGIEELQINNNPAFTGELGQTKRSSCQYGKVAGGVMGALVVKDLKTGVVFNIGTGFTDAERALEWKEGTIVKYKSQSHGEVEKPRSPVFLGIRDKIDL